MAPTVSWNVPKGAVLASAGKSVDAVFEAPESRSSKGDAMLVVGIDLAAEVHQVVVESTGVVA